MRRFVLTIVALILAVVSPAATEGTPDAVTMVSYEQGCIDRHGTLALKNNTSETVKSVNFMIEYIDMKGNQLDYRTFSERVDIAPGMTRKLDIDAYEHERHYCYYGSAPFEGYDKMFNIRFVLTGYNGLTVDESADTAAVKYSEDCRRQYRGAPENIDPDMLVADRLTSTLIVVVIAVALIVLGVTIGLYVLVAVMAKRRGRNVVLWVLLSIVGTPLLMAIILLAVGDERKEENFLNEEPFK